LFGSIARGDSRPESDVDLLVEFSEVPGFVGYVRLRNRLEEILGRRVDLVMASGLNSRIRERVLREAGMSRDWRLRIEVLSARRRPVCRKRFAAARPTFRGRRSSACATS